MSAPGCSGRVARFLAALAAVTPLVGCGSGPPPSPRAHISASLLAVANYSPKQTVYGGDLARFDTKWWLGGYSFADPAGQRAMLREGYHFVPSFNTGHSMRRYGLTRVPAATTRQTDPHLCIDTVCALNEPAILTEVQNVQSLLGRGGSYYSIGNEVDNVNSDDVSPAVFVGQFDAWVTAIKRGDPSAHIVAPNIDSWSCCTTTATNPFGTAGQWFAAFVAAYEDQHAGVKPPIDVLSMHLYNFDPRTADITPAAADNYVGEVRSFREAADRLGYAGKPIWITELGFLYPPGGALTTEQRSQIVHTVTELANAAPALKLRRLFWFTDNAASTVAAGLRPLFDPSAFSSPRVPMPLTDLGQLVSRLAANQ